MSRGSERSDRLLAPLFKWRIPSAIYNRLYEVVENSSEATATKLVHAIDELLKARATVSGVDEWRQPE